MGLFILLLIRLMVRSMVAVSPSTFCTFHSTYWTWSLSIFMPICSCMVCWVDLKQRVSPSLNFHLPPNIATSCRSAGNGGREKCSIMLSSIGYK